MKRHLSIWMLMARSTIYKVLGLLLALTAVDGALFAMMPWIEAQKLRKAASLAPGASVAVELERMFQYFPIVFGVCLLVLTALLCLNGCEFSAKQGYTLRRLRVPQWEIFFWQAVQNVVCYFLLWAVQAGIVVVLCRYYEAHYQEMMEWYPDMVTSQTVFLAFYRNSFLHSLLPLADAWRWARNAVGCVALGLCAAAFPIRQRRGHRSVAAAILAVLSALFFVQPMGYNGNGEYIAEGTSWIGEILALGTDNVAMVMLVFVAAVALYALRGGAEDEEA